MESIKEKITEKKKSRNRERNKIVIYSLVEHTRTQKRKLIDSFVEVRIKS